VCGMIFLIPLFASGWVLQRLCQMEQNLYCTLQELSVLSLRLQRICFDSCDYRSSTQFSIREELVCGMVEINSNECRSFD
jgi:hypothetical protein